MVTMPHSGGHILSTGAIASRTEDASILGRLDMKRTDKTQGTQTIQRKNSAVHSFESFPSFESFESFISHYCYTSPNVKSSLPHHLRRNTSICRTVAQSAYR